MLYTLVYSPRFQVHATGNVQVYCTFGIQFMPCAAGIAATTRSYIKQSVGVGGYSAEWGALKTALASQCCSVRGGTLRISIGPAPLKGRVAQWVEWRTTLPGDPSQ